MPETRAPAGEPGPEAKSPPATDPSEEKQPDDDSVSERDEVPEPPAATVPDTEEPLAEDAAEPATDRDAPVADVPPDPTVEPTPAERTIRGDEDTERVARPGVPRKKPRVQPEGSEEDVPPDRTPEVAAPPDEGTESEPPEARAEAASAEEAPPRPVAGESPGADPQPKAPPVDSALEKSAEEYVKELAKPDPEPIPFDRADDFVGPDQVIRLGPPPDDAASRAAETVPDPAPPAIAMAPEGTTEDAPEEDIPPGTSEAVAIVSPPPGPQGTEDPIDFGRTKASEELPITKPEPPVESPDVGTASRPEQDAPAPIQPAAPESSPAPEGAPDDPPAAEPPVKKVTEQAPAAEDRAAVTPAPQPEAPPPVSEDPTPDPSRDEETADAAPAPSAAPPDRVDAPPKDVPRTIALEPPPADDPRPPVPELKSADAEISLPRVPPPAPTSAEDPDRPRDIPVPAETITIRELLGETIEIEDSDVFYVHFVSPDDEQGLWGIIQRGVTENFARGVTVSLDKRTTTLQVEVPRHADELLDDRSSSPLGLMIHRKSSETIIYNRKLGRLTMDPAVTIFPGNELIIVWFKQSELVDLFKHFSGADGG